jgi:hypothetical protein
MSAPAAVGSEVPGRGDADELPGLALAFERRSLPAARWTHRAHLLLGLWYASRLPYEDAVEAMRAGILRLNDAHGVVTTPTRGYHETITRAYMRLIVRFVAEDGGEEGWSARAERLLARHGERDHLLRYYTRERLMSPEARLGWVEPDLHPLPLSGK